MLMLSLKLGITGLGCVWHGEVWNSVYNKLE